VTFSFDRTTPSGDVITWLDTEVQSVGGSILAQHAEDAGVLIVAQNQRIHDHAPVVMPNGRNGLRLRGVVLEGRITYVRVTVDPCADGPHLLL